MASADNNPFQMLDTKFTTQMAAFNDRLNESTAPPADLSALRADFRAFELMMRQALELLRKQYEQLDLRVDELEAHARRKVLLLHGVAESDGEDPAALVTRLCADKLGLEAVTAGDLASCNRLGRASSDANRKRPILVKFRRMETRANVWSAKTKLKGSGVLLSEFLTARRRSLFGEARKAFGMAKSWTRDGNVFVLASSGSAVRVLSICQLQLLMETKDAAIEPSGGVRSATVAGRGDVKQRPPSARLQSKPLKQK